MTSRNAPDTLDERSDDLMPINIDALIGGIYGELAPHSNIPRFDAPLTNPFGLQRMNFFVRPAFADLDGDGDFDAFFGGNYGDTFYSENTGTATAPQFAKPIINPFGLKDVGIFATPEFADLDNDGDLDAFIGNNSAGNIVYFENTGTATQPTFATPASNPFGLQNVGWIGGNTFADLDGDGDLDAVITQWNFQQWHSDVLIFIDQNTHNHFTTPVASGNEDQWTRIGFRQLLTSSSDTTASSFVVNAVTSGQLLIGASLATATAWAAGGNDVIDSSHVAFWRGDANANGTLPAFTVVGQSNNGTAWPKPVQAKINLTAVNDAPTGGVTIDGLAVEGRTLTVGNDLQDVDGLGAVSYQWQADGVAISGATGTSYKLTAADIGKIVTAVASYTDGDGTAESVSSAALAVQGRTRIDGTVQNDTLTGNGDDNALFGYRGDDRLSGDSGNDLLSGGNGNDQVSGGDGDDIVSGGTGDDAINGNAGNDWLIGGAGNDTLYGGNGDDKLTGNDGDDLLNGNGGSDVLFNSMGSDTLTGGSGNDSFVFNTAADDAADLITDFNPVDDTIKLDNAVFASLTRHGVLSDQHFIIGTAAADNNDFVIYDTQTGVLSYDADANGAAGAVAIAVLGSHLALTNADFLVI